MDMWEVGNGGQGGSCALECCYCTGGGFTTNIDIITNTQSTLYDTRECYLAAKPFGHDSNNCD